MSASGGVQAVDTSGVAGETFVMADSGNQANNTATATLPAAAGKTTYITGLIHSNDGATAWASNSLAVTGIAIPFSVVAEFPAQPLTGPNVIVITFPKPIPASAVNTPVVVSIANSGAGGTRSRVTAFGYQL